VREHRQREHRGVFGRESHAEWTSARVRRFVKSPYF
jgi:hypothetical protein